MFSPPQKTKPTEILCGQPKQNPKKIPNKPPTGLKSWNEFTNIDVKLILMKTYEIGLRKSTRTSKSKLPPKTTPNSTPQQIQNPKTRKPEFQINLEAEMLTPIRNYLKKRQLARASTSTPTPTPTPSTATSTTTTTTTNATCRKLQKARTLKTEPSCTLEPRPRKILSLVKQYKVNLSKNF